MYNNRDILGVEYFIMEKHRISEPKERYETRKACDELEKDLNISHCPSSQDFAYENATADDIEKYLELYNKTKDDDKKFVLMQMLIQSTEDQESDEKFFHYLNLIQGLIEKDFAIHEYTIWYWCLYDDHIEDAWRITPFMRDLWQKLAKTECS
jgi:hypothetical protein